METEKCKRPGCPHPVAPSQEHTPAAAKALCKACRCQLSSYRSSYGLSFDEALAKVMKPRKERAA